MKLKKPGIVTSGVEVSSISRKGVWVLVGGKEYFLSYERYPWFKKATASQLRDVMLLHGRHLQWKGLDVEVEFESLENPEKYPLVYH